MTTISFFRENEKYGEFSNFFALKDKIEWNNKLWSTSEHIYQAMKYDFEDAPEANVEYIEQIRKCNTPYKSKILANQTILSKYSWQQELGDIIKKFQKKRNKSKK